MSNPVPDSPRESTTDERELPEAGVVIKAEHEALLATGVARAELMKRMNALVGRGERTARGKKSGSQSNLWAESERSLQPGIAQQQLEARSLQRGSRTDANANAAPAGPREDYAGHGVFPTAGLALSGGGIRSAAFCTGAMQALQLRGVFPLFDYLSTVSGGGYAGATVTLNLANGASFPLVESDEKKDTAALTSIRNNANYLKFGSITATLKSAAIYFRGLTVNLVIVAAVLFALAGLTLLFNGTYDSLGKADIFGMALPAWLGTMAVTTFLVVTYLALNALWAAALTWRSTDGTGTRSKFVWFPALVIALIALAAFIEIQPVVVQKMFTKEQAAQVVSACASTALEVQCTAADGKVLPAGTSCAHERLVYGCKLPEIKDASGNGATVYFSEQFSNLLTWLQTLIAPLLAIIGFAASALGNVIKDEEVQNTWKSLFARNMRRLLIWGAALTFLLSMWLIYLTLVYWGVEIEAGDQVKRELPAVVLWTFDVWKSWGTGVHWQLFLLIGFLLFALQYTYLPNTNSLHRLYRDRLGAAFCFVQRFSGTEDHSAQKLSSLQGARPIPIINAAINLQNSEVVKSRGRKADFFSFTPLSIGCEATGYAEMKRFEESKGGADLDIATAVAISGAAASSNMGSQSMRPLSPLLAFLNIRLGYWLANPKTVLSQSRLNPNLWYFLNEALGRLNENRDTVYLTDGGHIENLGIYELLRRRCRLIVAVDAEADPKLTFSSFVTLQRYARIDLGVRIDMGWKDLAAQSLAAMSGTGKPQNGPHCAIGRIEYDKGGTGILVYIKSSVTGDENDYVREYNKRNADFPHESTGDQFFSEEQFEVYRALGFHAAHGMLTGEHLVEADKGLERLDDKGAKSELVGAAAMLLGVNKKSYPAAVQKPTVHLVKLLR